MRPCVGRVAESNSEAALQLKLLLAHGVHITPIACVLGNYPVEGLINMSIDYSLGSAIKYSRLFATDSSSGARVLAIVDGSRCKY